MAVDARSSTPVGQVPVVLHPLWLSSSSLGTCAFFRLTHSLYYFLTGLRLMVCGLTSVDMALQDQMV